MPIYLSTMMDDAPRVDERRRIGPNDIQRVRSLPRIACAVTSSLGR
jgi:hypothetical protein